MSRGGLGRARPCPHCLLKVDGTSQRHSDGELYRRVILGHDGLNGQAKAKRSQHFGHGSQFGIAFRG